jgi:hypothetical protein
MKKIALVIGVFVIGLISISGCTESQRFNKMFDVYITDAPFGKYWIHTWGRAVLFSGSDTYSELKETYTIKFMDGDELNTLLLASTDSNLHVHFTDDNSTMTINIQYQDKGGWDDDASEWREYMNGGGGPAKDFRFDLFVPRPEICELSNETIKQ